MQVQAETSESQKPSGCLPASSWQTASLKRVLLPVFVRDYSLEPHAFMSCHCKVSKGKKQQEARKRISRGLSTMVQACETAQCQATRTGIGVGQPFGRLPTQDLWDQDAQRWGLQIRQKKVLNYSKGTVLRVALVYFPPNYSLGTVLGDPIGITR